MLAALTAALHSLAGAAVGLLLWGLVHWLSFPLIQHRLLAIGGKNGDMLLALNNSAVYVGQTLAAIVGGLFASAGLLGELPLAAAGFEVLAGVALAFNARGLARRQPRVPATPVGTAEAQEAAIVQGAAE